MSIPLPPTPGIVFPPPPPPPPWSQPPAPPPAHHRNSSSAGGAIGGISIAVGVLLFVVSCIRGQRRQSGANAAADDAAAEAAALGLRPAAPDHQPRHGGQQPRGGALPPQGEPRRASTTAGLPSFTYNRSVKHKVTGAGAGEEAGTCSVCLGAFQVGETVQLLPVCLHLYHVECIDPWLEAHSSCPICRTGTEPAVDGGLSPPVHGVYGSAV